MDAVKSTYVEGLTTLRKWIVEKNGYQELLPLKLVRRGTPRSQF